MSDRTALLLPILLLLAIPVAAEPAVTLLDLPFKVQAMRGPKSEVAVSVATSGLLPLARPKAGGASADVGDEETAPLVVVWGDGGGAALSLIGDTVKATLLGADAIEGLVAAETPRGASPGTRRALSGPLSAYLTGTTRAVGGTQGAAAITVRERKPVAIGGDPKPVPVATITVSAGADSVFSLYRPRAIRLDGQPAFLATLLYGPARSGLGLVGRQGAAEWTLSKRSQPQDGSPLKIAAVADFARSGSPLAAAVKGPDGTGTLQLWSLGPGDPALVAEAVGYADGEGDIDLAATIEPDQTARPELALPVADRTGIAVVALNGGIKERLRISLPAPVRTGLAALGQGSKARLLAGLADGRLAVVALDGGKL